MSVVAALAMALPWEPTARLTIEASPRMALLIPLDPPASRVWIDRVPHGLSGLRRLGKHVPVVSNALQRRARRPVKAYLILACAPVPHRHRALAATFKIAPQAALIVSRFPTIGQDNVHGRKPQQTPRRPDKRSAVSKASESVAEIRRVGRVVGRIAHHCDDGRIMPLAITRVNIFPLCVYQSVTHF
jgi:hypothetical protein